MADLNATVARKRQSITGEDGNLWGLSIPNTTPLQRRSAT